MTDPVEDMLPIVRKLENSGDSAVSPAGAVGRYQIMPATARGLGIDPADLTDVPTNEKAARGVLKELTDRYPNDPKAVLTAYNAGPRTADKWIASGRNNSVLPVETQKYVSRAGIPDEPAEPPTVSPIQDRINKARAAGYSWDEINQKIAGQRAAAKASGYTDDEIDQYLGRTDPTPGIRKLQDQAQANVRLAQPETQSTEPKATTTTNPFSAFLAGVDQSSGGIVANELHDSGLPHNVIMPENAPMAARIAMKMGEAIGDIPAMVAGIIATKGAGAIATTAASFALPQAVKSTYQEGLLRGHWTSPQEFAEHWAAATWQTAKAGAIGVATGGAGALTAGAGFLAQKGAELAAMTTAASGLEGHLPSMQDVTDGAIVLGALHLANGGIATIHENLGAHWAATDEMPKEAAQRAQDDPVLRQKLQVEPTPEPRPNASVTKTKEGAFVVPPVDDPVLEVARLEREAEENLTKKMAAGEQTNSAGQKLSARLPDWVKTEEDFAKYDASRTPSEDPWASVGSRIAEEPPGKTWTEKAKTMAYEAYLGLFNPTHPINQLTKAIKEGDAIPDAENPDFVSRLAENSNTRAIYALEKSATDIKGNKTGPALNDIIGRFKTPEERQRFRTYAVARWALEKADHAKETGVHLLDANTVAKEGRAAYEPAFQDLVKFQNTTLGWLKDTGLLSESAHAAMVSENAARIPGYREGKQAREVPGAPGATGKVPGNPIKEFMGSERRILPIETSIMRDTFRRAALAERAYANRVAADGAEKVGLATKVGETEVPKTAVQAWMDDEDMTDQDALLAKVAGTHLEAEEVPVPRDGKLEKWVFSDPNIARVLRGYDRSDMTLLQRVAKPFANFQRAMVVLNPLFAPKVLWYDTQFQFLTKPGLRNTPADLVAGMRAVFGKTEDYDAWLRSGGADHVFDWAGQQDYIKDYLADKGDPTFAQRAWNTVNGPVRALQAWNRGWFSVMRAGRFVRGQAQGESTEASAYASSEAAFHRANWGGQQSKAINSVQPFFAAYLNGLEQTFKAYTGRNFAGDQMATKDVALNWTKAIATVTMVGLADWWANKDEAWYKAVPSWQKDNGFFIGGGDTHIFVPFPPLLGFLFNGLPKRAMQAYYEHDPRAFDNLAEGGAGAFAPPAGLFMMSAFTPVIEHITNHSFFKDAPLVNDDVKNNVLTPEQYGDYTTETAKQIARYVSAAPIISNFNLSPPVIENYIQGWGGTLGMAGIRAAEAGLSQANLIKVNEPAQKITEMPLISSFFARYPSASAQPIKDFRAVMDNFEQVHGSLVKEIKEGNFERFQEILNEHKIAAGAHMFALRGIEPPPDAYKFIGLLQQSQQASQNPYMEKVLEAQKAIENQRKQVQAIYLNSKLSPINKRQLMDQGYAMIQQMSEQALRSADQAGLK